MIGTHWRSGSPRVRGGGLLGVRIRELSGAAGLLLAAVVLGAVSLPAAAQPLEAEITANQTCGPAPLNVCFEATSPDLDPEAIPWSYNWDFGDGTYPTPNFDDPLPCHAFMTPDTQYIVGVSITDTNGDTAIGAILISTQELAVNICADVTSGPAPLLVQFNDGCGNVSGGVPPYFYDWDFGDGSDHCYDWATQHAYNLPGIYYVTLTVTDACDPTSVVTDTHIVVTVTQLNVTGNATATRTCGPPNTEVCFTGTAQGGMAPYTYSWNFGDGTAVVAGQAPCHVFTTAGTYTVAMTVTDALSNTYTDDHIQVIITPPLAVTSSASRTDGFAPFTVFFTSSVTGGTGPYNYSWDFGDGETATSGNVLHTYADPGSYTAVLTVTDSCVPPATATATPIPVAVYPIVVTATANRACGYAPLNVIFDASAEGGLPPYTYSWNFGDGTPGDTIANPSHSYLTVGTFTATVTVTDSLGRTGTGTVQIQTVPTLEVAIASTTVAGPAPLTSNVSSVVTGGLPPYTYDWDFGDMEPHSVADHDQHTWVDPGDYTLSLTVEDSCGHSVTSTLGITAYGAVAVAATSDLSCGTAPLSVCFEGTPAGGVPPYTYYWDFDDGTNSIDEKPCHNFISAGTYEVTVTVEDSLGSTGSTKVDVVVVAPLHLAVATGASTIQGFPPLAVNFTSSVSGASPPFTYAWDFGDGTTANSSTPQHIYDSVGVYTVSLTVTAEDACGTTYSATDSHLTVTVLEAPSIRLVSPADGGFYGGTVNLQSVVYDDVAVTRVDYFVNGALLGSSFTGPSYGLVWNSAGLNGTFSVYAMVFDSLGRSAVSETVSITLGNPVLDGRVQALQNPFRLKVYGSGLQTGCVVKINGANAPLTVYKGSNMVLVKGGNLLKAMLPKGVPVLITVVNPDGGISNSAAFTR